MPPKKGSKKPIVSELPAINTACWTGKDVLVDEESEEVKSYAPTGHIRQDVMAYTRIFRVPPHPAILPKKAVEQPAEGEAAPMPPAEGADPLDAYNLEGGDIEFSVTGYAIDSATFAALKLSLSACTSLTSLKFSNCSLTSLQIEELAAVVKHCSALRSLAVDYNPLGVRPNGPTAAAAGAGGEAPESKEDRSDGGAVDEADGDGKGGEDEGGLAVGESGSESETKLGGREEPSDAESKEAGAAGEVENEGDGDVAVVVPPEVAYVSPWASCAFRFLFAEDSPVAHLSLRGNGFTRPDMEAIADILRCTKNGNLTALSLGNNPLGDEGVSALLAGVRDNRTLRHLSLCRTGMTGKSARALGEACGSYVMSAEEAEERNALEVRLFGEKPAKPPTPPPEPKAAKGKKAKGKDPAPEAETAHPSLPPIGPHVSVPGKFVGVGNYQLQTLDLSNNLLDDKALLAVVASLFPDGVGSEPTESAPASARGKAPAAAKGKAQEVVVSPDEALAAGNLTLPVKPGVARLAVARNERMSSAGYEAAHQRLLAAAPSVAFLT